MKYFLFGALAALIALILYTGIAWYIASGEAEQCRMAEVHTFAMEACATGKRGVLCILTPSDIVELNRSAEILKSCAEALSE